MTKDYKSKIDPLAGYDYIQNDIYNVDKCIKDWFDTEIGLRNIDSIKYFNLFIENGYDTFELIKDIECVDLNEIGIVKKGHVNKIVKKINELNKYLDTKKKQQNIEQIQTIMNDIHECKITNNYLYLPYRIRGIPVICNCDWINHDTIPINQFAPISKEDREHIAKFHQDLHHRLLNKK
eukprot:206297_1